MKKVIPKGVDIATFSNTVSRRFPQLASGGATIVGSVIHVGLSTQHHTRLTCAASRRGITDPFHEV